MSGASSLRRLSRKRRQKNVYVFSVYWFFPPPPKEQLVVKRLSTAARGAEREGRKQAQGSKSFGAS